MNSFLYMLFACSLAGTVLAGVVWLLNRLAGGKLPKVCLLLAWLTVWVRLVLPLPTFLPAQTIPEPVQTLTDVAQQAPSGSVDMPVFVVDGAMAPRNPVEIVPQKPEAIETAEPERELVQAVPEADPAVTLSWGQILFVVWLAGVVGSLGYQLFSYHRLSRELIATAQEPDPMDLAEFRALCSDSRVRLLVHRRIGTALHMGLMRPVILLPEAQYVSAGKRDELQLILLHEYTHYKRRDLWLKWFATFATCLHWFNPLVYAIHRPWNEALEFACDEAVLTRLSPQKQLLYGETILETHRTINRITKGVTASFLGSGKQYLRERIRYIADFAANHAHRNRAAAVVTLVALILCACALGPVARVEEAGDSALPQATQTPALTSAPTAAPAATAKPTAAPIPTATAESTAVPTPIPTFPPFTMPGPAGDRPRATLAP